MKTKMIVLSFTAACAAFCAGCVSSAPTAKPVQVPVVSAPAEPGLPPVTNTVTVIITNTVYAPSSALSNLTAEVQSLAPVAAGIASLTPAAPVAPLIPSAANLVLGLITLVSTGIAAWKNSQANAASSLAAQQQAAAAALAAGLVHSATPPAAVQAANDAAALNGSTGTVAQALASAKSPV